MGVLAVDGISQTEAPGSLWEPAPTDLLPGGAVQLGLSFGLFMAGVRFFREPIPLGLWLSFDVVRWTRHHPIISAGHGQSSPVQSND